MKADEQSTMLGFGSKKLNDNNLIIIITRNELDFHVYVIYNGNDNVNNFSDIHQFYLTLLYQLKIMLSAVKVKVITNGDVTRC
jgi:hypothetical protein